MKLNVKKLFITLCAIFLISFNSVCAKSLISQIKGTPYITFDTELKSSGVQFIWGNEFNLWEPPLSFSTKRSEQIKEIANDCQTIVKSKIALLQNELSSKDLKAIIRNQKSSCIYNFQRPENDRDGEGIGRVTAKIIISFFVVKK